MQCTDKALELDQREVLVNMAHQSTPLFKRRSISVLRSQLLQPVHYSKRNIYPRVQSSKNTYEKTEDCEKSRNLYLRWVPTKANFY